MPNQKKRVDFFFLIWHNNKYNTKPPSSRGLGHLPFTEETGIRIPLGVKHVMSPSNY